jgi:DASS family divalent anion:Na+ symporter
VGCLLTDIVTWDSLLKNKAAWSTFIWYGGIISFATALANAKFFDWLGKLIGSNIDFTGMNSIVVLVAILVVSVLIRYFFASVAAFVSSMVPVFMTFGVAAQISPTVLTLMLGASALLGSLTTHYGNGVGPIIFGLGYVEQGTWWKVGHFVAFAGLAIFLTVGLPYWKILGLW